MGSQAHGMKPTFTHSRLTLLCIRRISRTRQVFLSEILEKRQSDPEEHESPPIRCREPRAQNSVLRTGENPAPPLSDLRPLTSDLWFPASGPLPQGEPGRRRPSNLKPHPSNSVYINHQPSNFPLLSRPFSLVTARFLLLQYHPIFRE